MSKYTKTTTQTVWDTDKIHVGDIIATNINCYRRHYNLSYFKSFEKFIREDFNVVAFVEDITKDKISILTADENGQF